MGTVISVRITAQANVWRECVRTQLAGVRIRTCVCVYLFGGDAQQSFNALFKSTHNVTPFPYKISAANAPKSKTQRRSSQHSAEPSAGCYNTICCGIDIYLQRLKVNFGVPLNRCRFGHIKSLNNLTHDMKCLAETRFLTKGAPPVISFSQSR